MDRFELSYCVCFIRFMATILTILMSISTRQLSRSKRSWGLRDEFQISFDPIKYPHILENYSYVLSGIGATIVTFHLWGMVHGYFVWPDVQVRLQLSRSSYVRDTLHASYQIVMFAPYKIHQFISVYENKGLITNCGLCL